MGNIPETINLHGFKKNSNLLLNSTKKYNFSKTTQCKDWKSGTPNKNPAIDEKTTLIAKPALVIALKSVKIDLMEMEWVELFKVCLLYFKTFAKE